MTDFKNYGFKLQKLHEVYGEIAKNTEYIREKPATERVLKETEKKLEYTIPPCMRELFIFFSRKIVFSAWLPEELELPHALRDIFSASFEISVDELINAERSRKSWVNECFSNPLDSYDKVWHNKLGFMTVANGDVIAFDLDDDRDDKRVIYLSHDDGRGHGYVLGDNFDDFFCNLLLVGGCGNEDWQMMPFIENATSGINPNCENAKIFRELIGLYW